MVLTNYKHLKCVNRVPTKYSINDRLSFSYHNIYNLIFNPPRIRENRRSLFLFICLFVVLCQFQRLFGHILGVAYT